MIQNQADIIRSVAEDILGILEDAVVDFEIICVENGSRDETLTVLRELAESETRIRVYTAPKGYGSAILAGLPHARGAFVAYMPSDGQCDAKILPGLIQIMKSGGVDLIKTRRKSRENTLRAVVSFVFNLLSRITFGIETWDINGSPKILRRSYLPILKLTSGDSFIDTELLRKAQALHWEIKEVDMENFNRRGGESSTSYRTVIEFLKNIISYRFGPEFRRWKDSLQSKH